MGKIIEILIVVLIFVGLFFALKTGIEKTEKAECLKWQHQAKDYPLFYLTKAQVEQCQALKIDITASIR